MHKPQFKNIFLETFIILNKSFVQLCKALLIPFILFLILDLLLLFNLPQYIEFFLIIPRIMLYTIFAVITHRIILLGVSSVPQWGLKYWTKRESYFAVHMVLLSFLSMAIILLIQYIPQIGIILGILASFYIAARVSLVFPATAIDQGSSFKSSWQLTKHHQNLMIMVIFVLPLVFRVPVLLTQLLPYTLRLTSIANLISTILIIGNLSLAYGKISKYEFKS